MNRYHIYNSIRRKHREKERDDKELNVELIKFSYFLVIGFILFLGRKKNNNKNKEVL